MFNFGSFGFEFKSRLGSEDGDKRKCVGVEVNFISSVVFNDVGLWRLYNCFFYYWLFTVIKSEFRLF